MKLDSTPACGLATGVGSCLPICTGSSLVWAGLATERWVKASVNANGLSPSTPSPCDCNAVAKDVLSLSDPF